MEYRKIRKLKQSTKEIGIKTSSMGRAGGYSRMGIFMKETSNRGMPVVMGSTTIIPLAIDTKGIGRTIYRMVMVSRRKLMAKSMKGSSKKELSMGRELICGQMGTSILEIG